MIRKTNLIRGLTKTSLTLCLKLFLSISTDTTFIVIFTFMPHAQFFSLIDCCVLWIRNETIRFQINLQANVDSRILSCPFSIVQWKWNGTHPFFFCVFTLVVYSFVDT